MGNHLLSVRLAPDLVVEKKESGSPKASGFMVETSLQWEKGERGSSDLSPRWNSETFRERVGDRPVRMVSEDAWVIWLVSVRKLAKAWESEDHCPSTG